MYTMQPAQEQSAYSGVPQGGFYPTSTYAGPYESAIARCRRCQCDTIGTLRAPENLRFAGRMWQWRTHEVQSDHSCIAEDALAGCGVRGHEYARTPRRTKSCAAPDHGDGAWLTS